MNRGSALIACVIMAVLFLTSVLWFAEWSRIHSVAGIHRMSSRQAMAYADDGVNHAVARLKTPRLQEFLNIGDTTSYSLTMPNGRVDIVLARQSPDVNLIDLHTTAYYYIGRGSFQDPMTGQKAQRAAINAKYRITSIGQFLIAVPSSLAISYGTNAPLGMIYASQLQFLACSAPPCVTPTRIRSAYYYDSVQPSAAPAFVEFTSPPPMAQRLTHPMNFSSADPTLRSYYMALATQPLPASFDGIVPEPSPSHVYFVDGDLHIAQTTALRVQGVYIIYATGNVFIHDNILLQDANSFVGVLSEKNIHLASDAPNNLTLNGYFVCNGIFKGDPLPGNVTRTGVNLLINGGIVSMTGIDIATAWQGQRTYTYQMTSSSDFVLPNFSQPIEYKILGGKLH